VLRFVQRSDVLPRHDENVNGRLRVDVTKGDAVLALHHDRSRDLFADDAAEQALLSHASLSSRYQPGTFRPVHDDEEERRPRSTPAATTPAVSKRKVLLPRDAGTQPNSRAMRSRSASSSPPSGPSMTSTARRRGAVTSGLPCRSRRNRSASSSRREVSASASGSSGCTSVSQAPPDCSSAPTIRARTFLENASPMPRGPTLDERRKITGCQRLTPNSELFSASHNMRSRSATGTSIARAGG